MANGGAKSQGHLTLPEAITARFAGYEWTQISRWPETRTWRVSGYRDRTFYVKLTPADYYPSAIDEGERIRWAKGHLPVPEVLDLGANGTVSWLVMTALPGLTEVDATLMSQRETLARLHARALRRFHAAPVETCPFDFRLDRALAHVRDRVHRGLVMPERHFHPEHSHLTAEGALDELERLRPSSEDLVVCHGDFCLPNVLTVDGEPAGFIDLGELGVADRWWDLAVGSWTLDWNLGPGHTDTFFEAYGVEPDDQRIHFFRLLYDLVS